MPSQAIAWGRVTTGLRRAYTAELATRITWPASAMSRWISFASSEAAASGFSTPAASPRVSRMTSETTCGGGGSSSDSSAMAS